MPQFDFFTSFNQILFGFLSFFMLYRLFTFASPSPDRSLFYIEARSEREIFRDWEYMRKFLNFLHNGLNNLPSYLYLYHFILWIRKVKFLMGARKQTLLSYFVYFKSLQTFIRLVNWLIGYLLSTTTAFLMISKNVAHFVFSRIPFFSRSSSFFYFFIYTVVR